MASSSIVTGDFPFPSSPPSSHPDEVQSAPESTTSAVLFRGTDPRAYGEIAEQLAVKLASPWNDSALNQAEIVEQTRSLDRYLSPSSRYGLKLVLSAARRGDDEWCEWRTNVSRASSVAKRQGQNEL